MTTGASRPSERGLPAEAGAASPSGDRLASELRGFGPLGIFAILVILFGNLQFHVGDSGFPVIVPSSAVLVLVWARLSRTPWREIGYARPKSWIVAVTGGIAFGIAFKFLMKAIVMPLLGADPINRTYHFLAGNRAAIPFALFGMIVGAGFGEETVFRGFLFERLGKLFGRGGAAKAVIVLLTALWFGLGHYSDQGLAGAEQATVVGLVFGSIFAVTGRIGMLMVAHAAFDLTAYAIIYWDLETAVAHAVFP
jgi:membrane protease YdiL (CAAX protease family)